MTTMVEAVERYEKARSALIDFEFRREAGLEISRQERLLVNTEWQDAEIELQKVQREIAKAIENPPPAQVITPEGIAAETRVGEVG